MSSTTTATIVFDHVSFIPQGKEVFTDFSLSLNAGEKTVIQGPSGSGKSTLLYMLLGIVPLHSGTVRINGCEVNERSCWELRKNLAYLPQNISIFEADGRQFLDHIFNLGINRDNSPSSTQLSELLDYFELSENHLDSPVSQLSGGERQRLGLIAAILLNRDIMLLDEPTAALDSNMKNKVVEWTRKVSRKTILVISHDEVWNRQYDVMRTINWDIGNE